MQTGKPLLIIPGLLLGVLHEGLSQPAKAPKCFKMTNYRSKNLLHVPPYRCEILIEIGLKRVFNLEQDEAEIGVIDPINDLEIDYSSTPIGWHTPHHDV